MADIDPEVEVIRSNLYGENVRNAIADAAAIIANSRRIDISQQINTIRSSRYGYEIRESIISALNDLSAVEPEPPSTTAAGSSLSSIKGAVSYYGGYTEMEE